MEKQQQKEEIPTSSLTVAPSVACSPPYGVTGLPPPPPAPLPPPHTQFFCRPAESAILYHTVKSSEFEQGLQCIIVRNCPLSLATSQAAIIPKLPSQLAVDASKVQALLEGRQAQTPHLVFLQTSPPARNFCAYDQTKDRIVMTGASYLRLLDFFSTEWERVASKLHQEYLNMKECREFIRIVNNLYFVGHGVATFRRALDPRLWLTVSYDSQESEMRASLEYSCTEGDCVLLGSCPISLKACSVLAKGRTQLEKLMQLMTDISAPAFVAQAGDSSEGSSGGYKEGASKKPKL